jgi:cell division protease FtsH
MYSEEEEEVFLGRSVTQHKNVSDDTAHTIDEEVRNFIDRNYERAGKILDENMEKLHVMAEALIKYETIDTEQINDIMAGKKPRPPKDWDEGDIGSDDDTRPSGESPSSDDVSGTIGDPAGQH